MLVHFIRSLKWKELAKGEVDGTGEYEPDYLLA